MNLVPKETGHFRSFDGSRFHRINDGLVTDSSTAARFNAIQACLKKRGETRSVEHFLAIVLQMQLRVRQPPDRVLPRGFRVFTYRGAAAS